MTRIKALLNLINSSIIDRYGYHVGLIALFFPIAVLFFARAFSLRPPVLLIFVLQMVGLVMLGGVVTIKTIRSFLQYRKNRFLKWGLGITNTLLVGTVSLILTKEIINMMTETDPSHFTVSMKVFPVLLLPVAWMMVIGVAAFLYMIALITKLNLLTVCGIFTGGAIEPPPLLTSLGKVFGAASIFLIAVISLLMLIPQTNRLGTLLVQFDYVSKSECPNRRPEELVKDLHNGRISVAVPRRDGSFSFEIRPCEGNTRMDLSDSLFSDTKARIQY